MRSVHDRRWWVLAAVLGLAVIGAGCGETPKSPGPGRYRNAEHGFSIVFPEDWEVREGGGPAVMALSKLEDPKDKFRENVNVVVEPLREPMAAKAYYEGNIKDVASKPQFKDFRVKDSGELKIGDATAWRAQYSVNIRGSEHTILVYALTRGKTGYVITCAAAPDQFEKYKPTFEEVAKSFRLE